MTHKTDLVELHHADCLEALKTLADNSVSAIVTDPPYGLSKHDPEDIVACLKAWMEGKEYKPNTHGFMGKTWDAWVPSPVLWKEVYRVLKLGGHLAVFAGTRTHDLMGIALRLAGFELRDTVMWMYGCLSEDTEILTINGWEPYHKDIENHPVLCYITDEDRFEFQKPTRSFIYENEHPAYKIKSDFTDQIVSRNHRVLVERDGRKVFAFAETLSCQEDIPFLESLHDLPETIPHIHKGTSCTKRDLLKKVFDQKTAFDEKKKKTQIRIKNDASILSKLQKTYLEKKCVVEKDKGFFLFKTLQRYFSRKRMEKTRTQGASVLETKKRNGISEANDWEDQPCLERWCYLFQNAWELCRSKIYSVSHRVFEYGSKRRLCYGASNFNCEANWASSSEGRGYPSHRPQSRKQQTIEPNTIPKQRDTQKIRRTLATVTEITYRGNVWCVEVPAGAFVARRNGKIFITGNSGFPKSLDVGKALHKKAGIERQLVDRIRFYGKKTGKEGATFNACDVSKTCGPAITETAKQWDGWGTALKPAFEPILIFRKPMDGTVAENCLKHGVGALNIDGCRIPTEEQLAGGSVTSERKAPMTGDGRAGAALGMFAPGAKRTEEWNNPVGRWPANVVHDGSDEVVSEFPESAGQQGDVKGTEPSRPGGKGIYSVFSGQVPAQARKDSGSAARFFYTAKTSAAERHLGTADENVWNKHPTVKPLSLMRYLVKLLSGPEPGLVLDPFMGSGTTGMACLLEGQKFVGMEQEAEYYEIAKARISYVEQHKTQFLASLKAEDEASKKLDLNEVKDRIAKTQDPGVFDL